MCLRAWDRVLVLSTCEMEKSKNCKHDVAVPRDAEVQGVIEVEVAA